MPIGSFFSGGCSEIVGPELPSSQLMKRCGHSAPLHHPRANEVSRGISRRKVLSTFVATRGERTEHLCHEIPPLAALARDDRKTLLAANGLSTFAMRSLVSLRSLGMIAKRYSRFAIT